MFFEHDLVILIIDVGVDVAFPVVGGGVSGLVEGGGGVSFEGGAEGVLGVDIHRALAILNSNRFMN